MSTFTVAFLVPLLVLLQLLYGYMYMSLLENTVQFKINSAEACFTKKSVFAF